MKPGDLVEWSSQSQGHLTLKRGTVIAVVPPDVRPDGCLPDGFTCASGSGFGAPRRHESYLVQVEGKGKRLYWPKVKYLGLVPRLKHKNR